MQLFGDNNTLVYVAYECVVITKKLQEIPYHTVNHWTKACNPFLPCQFVSLHYIMFTGQVACVLFLPMASASEACLTYSVTYGVGQISMFVRTCVQ